MSSFRTASREAAQVLLNDESLSRSTLWTYFVAEFPEATGLLPAGVTEATHSMVCVPGKALLRVADTAPDDESVDPTALAPAVEGGLRDWALHMRRTGFPSAEYPRAAKLYQDLIASMLGHGLDERVARTLEEFGEVMRSAAEQADQKGIPAASAAQVTSVIEASSFEGAPAAARTRIVRLETSTPIPYEPGQVVPVLQANRQGVWHDLAPALPYNELGQLEFHVREELDVEVGDYVTLGAAYGTAPLRGVDKRPDHGLLIVADGTGLAAAKAMVFDLMERDERPEVELMIGVEHEDEFYDLHTFASLTSSSEVHDWLTITCVAEQVMDPEDPESPAIVEGLRRVWIGVERLASATGTWWGRDVVVCGSVARCTLITDAMKEAGASAPTVVAMDEEADWFNEH